MLLIFLFCLCRAVWCPYFMCSVFRYDFRKMMMFGSPLHPVVCCLIVFLCLFAHITVAHLFGFLCCLLFCLFVCLVYLMLIVSLDCTYLIAPSVFSNIYCGHLTIL